MKQSAMFSGRVRVAWLASLLIHTLAVAAVAFVLWRWMEPATQPPAPKPLKLSMFQAVPPIAKSAPPEQTVEATTEPVPEPVPVPVTETVIAPEPVPIPKSEPPPKPQPKSKPETPKPAPVAKLPRQVSPIEASPPSPVLETSAQPEKPVVAPPTEVVSSPPVPVQPTPNADLENAYRARIRAAVDAHKHYPPLARRMGQEGQVKLAFTVDAEGRLLDVTIITSSGSASLDEAALQAVRDAAPFPPFPEGSQRQRWNFSIPLTFSLEH
ncbi:MAG: energy transducer TonB [Gammaproteobacteria bacterium]|nr:energy transducer TonB [Gammaproteobacteria bacterium]